MNHALLEKMRNAYEYPPAKILSAPPPPKLLLAGHPYTVHDPFDYGWPRSKGASTSWDLDDYHKRLLNSGDTDDRFLGVVSVVYWGYRARSSGSKTGNAEERARWMILGRSDKRKGHLAPTDRHFVSEQVAKAKSCLAESKDPLKKAIQELTKIKFISLSFASKLLAFMDPTHCAVLDSVVRKALQHSTDPTLNSIRESAIGFQKWCDHCQTIASDLNALPSTWTDWDSRTHEWRAVDVERAVFKYVTLPRDPADVLS